MSTLDENVPSGAPNGPGDPIFTPTIDPQSKDSTNVFPLDGVNIESVSDEHLILLGDTAPVLYQIGPNKVVRISRDLALKCGPSVLPSEAKALDLARRKTVIRVPHVYRSFQVDDPFEYYGTRGYLVMDYIEGRNLGDCWMQLAAEDKADVISQSAAIISQLQSTVLPTPGPIGGGPCRGKLFTDYGAGPLNSGSEMEAWLNHKLEICKHYNQTPQDIPPFKFRKFVLVHQDISPRNMILDAAGQVWLIDWAHAGAYPPAVERAAVAEQHLFPEFNKMLLNALPHYDAERRFLRRRAIHCKFLESLDMNFLEVRHDFSEAPILKAPMRVPRVVWRDILENPLWTSSAPSLQILKPWML
ncbi:conserved hypothetical protein [Coccidioides posadasii str. Silveira]|uniref:Aminoglycoside phosphotransferase domain-containing protein n=1 Tax=Coccidioides posadasii (strain RMSCC 757 / Silveira) TaxID=443226 RepID=E9D009_COCPS|nr:conserved hypothetical protein [Coccidioides posadasii str. Silveira]